MRRLTGLTQQKLRFILTSATLGVQGKSENDIVEFASNLISVKKLFSRCLKTVLMRKLLAITA